MNEEKIQGNAMNRQGVQPKLLWLVGLIVVLGLLVGGLLYYRHHTRTTRSAAHSAMMSRSNKLIASAQYTSAEQILQNYLDTKPPTSYKRDAMSQLTIAYSAAGDLQSALTWYKKIAQLDVVPQLDTTVGLAYTYQALKDNQNAIKYFKQAIALEQKTSSPDKTGVIATYTYLIKQMGGSI